MKELVSIIMPSYNSDQFIEETIKSIFAQTYENWELILVDDCSTDNSIAYIEPIVATDKRINFIKLVKNSGPAIARNRAIKQAKGRYIAFLDSDDIWMPEKLSKQLTFMQKNDIALSFTSYYHIEEESERIINQVHALNKVNYSELLKKNIIGCFTAIYDTEKLGKVYMPDIRKRQDYALWLSILKKVPYAYGLDEMLGYYRVRSNSVSSNKILSSKYNWKLYREIEKLPLYKAIYYFGWYTYKSFLKYK